MLKKKKDIQEKILLEDCFLFQVKLFFPDENFIFQMEMCIFAFEAKWKEKEIHLEDKINSKKGLGLGFTYEKKNVLLRNINNKVRRE